MLVNPPRRGIGKPLCDYLSTMAPRFIIYSSCNAQTMAKDIRELPGFRIERVQLFDMFPHTAHYEVLTLLVKQKSRRCGFRLLIRCALFMPDAACTPYPAYKIMLNQYIAELMWAG